MKIDVTSFDGQSAGSIELNDAIFGLEPREDLIARMVRYQLAKRRAGTHAVKNRAERSAGPARSSTSRRAPAAPVTALPPRERSSAAVAGPSVRLCAAMRHDLPKKVRQLALRMRCRRRPRTAA